MSNDDQRIVRVRTLGIRASEEALRTFLQHACRVGSAPSTGVYPHFAAFLRAAPAEQVDALLAAVGEAIARWSRPGKPWVSTAGMGVPWLHVRLDSRPKYFRHAPYRAGG